MNFLSNFLNLYFDKINQPGQHLQVTFHMYFFPIKFTFRHEIQKINFLTLNSTQFSGFFLSKSKFDLKKYDK